MARKALEQLSPPATAPTGVYLLYTYVSCRSTEKPKNVEVTAMGAAFAAGLGVGFWDSLDELNNLNDHDTRWTPGVTQDFVEAKIRGWNDAVEKSLNWV